jgi:hypothetical protein
MERTDHDPGQPTPRAVAPQPNRILAEPAAQAADVRQTLAAQEARQR